MKQHSRIDLLFLLILLGCSCIGAQEDYRKGWYQFVIPDLADEDTSGAFIDLSFLNPEPAGANGFLRAEAERIVDGSGKEVRLFGTNICDYHPMPSKDNAPRIAKRLKELGFNFVRLHFFDWAKAPSGILNDDMQTLNPEKLDQFDYLFSCLKDNGIYVDINLHVCRPYPNQPEGIGRFGKGIDFIHEPYIESQKRYARDLIGHQNPYTGLSYANDPAVAVVELNNENSVFVIWSILAGLPDEFSNPIKGKWNVWLKNKYQNTEELRRAWNKSTHLGEELLTNGSFAQKSEGWKLETHAPGEANATFHTDVNGKSYMRWNVTNKGREIWHMQFYTIDVPLEHGKTYVASFRARCVNSLKARLAMCVMMQEEPWEDAGGSVTLTLSDKWEDYSAAWTISNAKNIPLRLNFSCLNEPGVFEISDISLREGFLPGLKDNHTIEKGDIPLVSEMSNPQRTSDYISFLMDAEADYVQAMQKVLRDELGSKSIVFCSQVNYRGLSCLKREASLCDAIDAHCYPCHPHWANNNKGEPTLLVKNESMVGRAFGDIEKNAFWRLKGKPFLMTEFDLNPPNDHASENFPLLALMASYQGWAGFNDYSWYNFQDGKQGHNHIISHFATTGHPGQMCMIPSMAMLYRKGLVKTAQKEAVLACPELEIAKRMASDIKYGIRDLLEELKVAPEQAWCRKVSNNLVQTESATITGMAENINRRTLSDTGEILFDRTQNGMESLQVNAPAARMLIGYTGGRDYQLGDVGFSVSPGTSKNYANISLVALDGLPIGISRKALLTVVARVENSGQKWNQERTSTGYGFGDGITLAEPVELTVTLPGKRWQAYALSGSGKPVRKIPIKKSQLVLNRSNNSLWYALERK